jgi:preprotein translocase subunit SecD
MSRKKLARITIGCIIAIIMVTFVAGCNSPPEPTLSLTYQADLTGIELGTEDEIMDGVKAVIERRINALGITKSSVQAQKQEDEYNIVIQASGDFDLEKTKEMIPLFSILEFREQDAMGDWIPATGTVNGQNLTLSSRYFKQDTYVDLDTYGRPLLVFEWDETGAQLSEQITTRLLGKPLGIYLGDEPLRGEDGQIIAPIVMAVIIDKGQIEGLSLADATELKDLLNAGRIDVPLGYWAEEGQSKVFVPNIPIYEQVTG